MAGFYPDAPDHKVFYNDDGTVVFSQPTSGGAVTPVGVDNPKWLNGEDPWANACPMSGSTRMGFAFPQAMNIVGIYCLGNGNNGDSSGLLRTSTDTTNGTDGTWTVVTSSLAVSGNNDPTRTTRWRTHIQTVSCTGIKGLTLSANSNGSAVLCHLYGRPTTGANPDRLRFWHPTTDTEVLGPHFDYGDLPQGQTSTVQFRIKNNSTTKTANTITVADDALTNASPTLATQTSFSADGSSFSASLGIGTLAPGALSSVLHARVALAVNAQVGPWRQRIKATANTWT